MNNQQSGSQQQFQSIDERTATAFLREGSIGRQQQSGSLAPDVEEGIRMGQQDQSLGFDDAVYALTNADKVWPKVHESLGSQQT